jgi:23S rRNA (pseudouridine1915-N3)-methyltransferase
VKVTIAAIGRLKAGPEHEILDRYLKRAESAGRRLGLAFAIREMPESRATSSAQRKAQEAAVLLGISPPGAPIVALDEAGKSLDSHAFATRLEGWRDSAVPEVAFFIGGADGLGPELLKRADMRLAFGAMTWPHQLVRVMLAEQFYRAVTILAGHPYHRE